MCAPIRNNCFSSTIYNVPLNRRLRLSRDIMEVVPHRREVRAWMAAALSRAACTLVDMASLTVSLRPRSPKRANVGAVTMKGYAGATLS